MSKSDNLNNLLELRARAESRFLSAANSALPAPPQPLNEDKVGRAAALAMVCGRIDTIIRREIAANRRSRK